jgi:16S rRNA (uracil1498-N3)-methyltransferase
VIDKAGRATLRRAAAHVLVGDVDAPVIDDASSHHVFRVLRVRDGDSITITDGQGRWRPCRASATALVPVGEASGVAARSQPCTVAFAIPKSDRPEWIVQKLTELGVDRIVLLHAERSVVRWDADRAERHLSKLRRVAVEALQQSRGVWLPSIMGPIPAREVLPELVVAEPGGRSIASGDRRVAIGPEGGWSDEELALATDRVTLGDRVLRVETAALTAGVRLVANRD